MPTCAVLLFRRLNEKEKGRFTIETALCIAAYRKDIA
jgi:hypothetical protein